MLCTSCGADLGTRSPKFCLQCGAPLPADKALASTSPATAMSPPDNDAAIPLSAYKIVNPPQDPVATDDDATVLLSARKVVTLPKEPVATDDDATVLLSARKVVAFPKEPVATDDDTTVLLSAHRAPKASQEPVPALLSAPKAGGVLQKSVFTPPPRPDVMTTAFTVPTMILSGRGKKKHKKARARARPPAQKANPLIEPAISSSPGTLIAIDTIQKDPVFFRAAETSSPVSLEWDNRIVLESPYPGSFPAPERSVHPAVFGIAVLILVVFFSGVWWWNSGEMDYSPGNADAMLSEESSLDSLPDTEPSLAVSAPASPTENIPAPSPKQGPEQELRNIPSLPTNQKQGRHNQNNPNGVSDQDPIPLSPFPLPLSVPSTPTETTSRTKIDSTHVSTPTPATTPATTNPSPDIPPWLEQMRRDLSNCKNFYCRENIRDQYCTSQWKTLPECKGASL